MTLASMLGTRLLLWTGGVVPTPPPSEVLAALVDATVTNDAERGDGFQIRFKIERGLVDYNLGSSGALAPWNRVVLGLLLGPVPEPLIDGIITHHQVSSANEPGMSMLTVTGKDVSIMMDLEEKNASYPNQPDFVIFSQIVAKYAQYGLVPLPTPTTDIPIELQRTPNQAETDLKFIQRLARRNGFVFYVSPLTIGTNQAYFGPDLRAGILQPAINVGLGPSTNADTLNVTSDSTSPVSGSGTFFESTLGITLPIPPLPSLKLPPLTSSPLAAKRKTLIREEAHQGATRALLASATAATNAPDPVQLSGSLDGVRYGTVLRARNLVGVRGAGATHDGIYFVSSVTHRVARGSYTQQFTLKREGTGALLPVVRPS